jgi:SAM-dependent methyltransferase
MQSDSAYKQIVDSTNLAAYGARGTVDWYTGLDFILRPEAAILEKISSSIAGKKLLDIGIGAGRTTRWLSDLSGDYTGIDYTSECIESARRRFPGLNLLCRDARDLHEFSDMTFDFVLFSFNAIDYMIHEDRMNCLAQIHRILKPGGLFMFSTHNRDHQYFDKLPWRERRFDMNHIKSCLYTLVHLPRHYRMKKYEVRTEQYAIINDNAHGFSLLAYYTSFTEQLRQLHENGFVAVEAWDVEGNPTQGDVSSAWIYYLAQASA